MKDGVEVRVNSIRIHFRHEGRNCKETLKIQGNIVQPTPANIKYAKHVRGKIMLAIMDGTFDYLTFFPDSQHAIKSLGRDTLVHEWYEHFMATQVIATSTRKGYSRSANSYFLPIFGHRRALDVRKAELDCWRAKLTKQYRPKTVNNVLIIARAIFAAAYEEIENKRSPAAHLRNVKNPRRAQDAPDPYSYEEIGNLCDNIIVGNQEQESNLWEFWSLTGPRPGEMIALEWRDIDFENAVMHIQRNRVEGEEGTPKAASHRFVDLVPQALEALRKQKEFGYSHSAKVFKNPRTGKPWHNDDVVYKALKRTCERAGVRFRPPYQLRHTFACNMLSAGEWPYYVKEQLGHVTLQMLERSYGKWMRTAKKSQNALAGQKFTDFVTGEYKKTP